MVGNTKRDHEVLGEKRNHSMELPTDIRPAGFTRVGGISDLPSDFALTISLRRNHKGLDTSKRVSKPSTQGIRRSYGEYE